MKTRLAFLPGLLALALGQFTALHATPPSAAQDTARAILQGADRDAVLPKLAELLKNLPSTDFPTLVAELR